MLHEAIPAAAWLIFRLHFRGRTICSGNVMSGRRSKADLKCFGKHGSRPDNVPSGRGAGRSGFKMVWGEWNHPKHKHVNWERPLGGVHEARLGSGTLSMQIVWPPIHHFGAAHPAMAMPQIPCEKEAVCEQEAVESLANASHNTIEHTHKCGVYRAS